MTTEAINTNAITGKEWARLSQLKPGDVLVADGGFDCIEDGHEYTVAIRDDGALYVPCRTGQHILDGQLLDDNDHLVGFVCR